MLRHLNIVHSFILHVTAQKKWPYIHSYTGAGYKASKLKNVQTTYTGIFFRAIKAATWVQLRNRSF